MAKDNQVSYTLLGTTFLAGVAAIVVVLIRFGGVGSGDHEYLAESYYDYPVSGLSVGSSVYFRGVKVGEVRDIDFVRGVYRGSTDAADAQRIRMLLALDTRRFGSGNRAIAEATVREYINDGLRATVSSSGITGLSNVDLNLVASDEAVPLPTLTWMPKFPLIPPQPSFKDSVLESAGKMFERFNQVDFMGTWSNVQSVAESSARLCERVDALVAAQSRSLSTTMQNAEEATISVRELSDKLNRDPSLLLRPNDPKPLPETSR